MYSMFGNSNTICAIIGRLHETPAKRITHTGIHNVSVITGKPIATTFIAI
jgi:hypothetical protein